MGKKYTDIPEKLQSFIQRQKIFFVATAACEGRINMSPKGLDTLRILNKNRVIWLNLTGNGNETAAHLLDNDRMTVMFCAFEGEPLILRLYGHALAIHPRDIAWNELIVHFPLIAGARQVIDMTVDLVHCSCGIGVPYFNFVGERNMLAEWAEKKGKSGIKEYWRDRNQISLDGKQTKILDSN